jgi:hypothetical protein
MARMKTSRMTAKMGGPGDPPKTTVKKESSAAGDWGKYEAYVKQKKAYDTDKTEYDARWKRSNEMSGGSISPYNFEAAPAEVKPPVNDRVTVKIAKREPGKLAGYNGKKEATAFVSPAPATKTKTKTGRALTGGGSGLKKVGSETGTLGSARAVKGTKNVAKAGYKREGELFKANAQTSALGKDFSKMTSGEIKGYRKELKSERRDFRKSGVDADTKQQAITGNTMDIRQSRKAEKFAKKAYEGTLKSFKPSKVAEYKSSIENAANRNTMAEKIKRAGAKAAGFNGQMPL